MAATIYTLASTNLVRRSGLFACKDSTGDIVIHGRTFINASGTEDSTQRYIESYHPATGVWTTKSQPTTIHSAQAYSLHNDQIQAFGDWDVTGNTTVGRLYDIPTDTWSTLTSVPSSGYDQPIVWTIRTSGPSGPSGDLYLVGSLAGAHFTPQKFSAGVWSTAAAIPTVTHGWANDWTPLWQGTTVSPCGGSVLDSADRVYVFADSNSGTGTANQAVRYDPGLNSWTTLTNAPANLRHPAVAITPADVVYLISTGFYSYTISTNTWATLTSSPVSGSLIYDPSTSKCYSIDSVGTGAIYEYDIAANTWTGTGLTLSVVRTSPSIVYDGVGYYLICGGSTSGTTAVDYFSPTGVPPFIPGTPACPPIGPISGTVVGSFSSVQVGATQPSPAGFTGATVHVSVTGNWTSTPPFYCEVRWEFLDASLALIGTFGPMNVVPNTSVYSNFDTVGWTGVASIQYARCIARNLSSNVETATVSSQVYAFTGCAPLVVQTTPLAAIVG